MIPFGGFMPAITGAAILGGGKAVNHGTKLPGLSETGEPRYLSDDEAGSFLAWVQKVMDSGVTVESGDNGNFDIQNDDRGSDFFTLDQLQALITDAIDQSSTGQSVPQTLNPASLDNGQKTVPPGTMTVINVHHDDNISIDSQTRQVLTAVPAMVVSKDNAPVDGPIQYPANDPPWQTAVLDLGTQTGQISAQGDDHQKNENPLILDAKKNTPVIGFAKEEKSSSLLKPVVPACDERNYPTEGFIRKRLASDLGSATNQAVDPASALPQPGTGQPKDQDVMARPLIDEDIKASASRFIQGRLTSDSGTSNQAVDPAPTLSLPIAGQTEDPESRVTALTEEKTGSSKDDTPNSQGKDKYRQSLRIELADVNENDLQKGQPSDSEKPPAFEPTKTSSSFEDPAKSMALDPSTTLSEKPTVGQSAPAARTDMSMARTFQTAVMDQIVDKAAIRSMHGRSEIQIRLKPEFLGNVQMNIATEKEQVVVRILTDQPMVKEIIETHLHHLKAELQNQGLIIDKFDVMVNPDADQQHSREQFAQTFRQHSSQNGRRQPPEQNPETMDREDGHRHGEDSPKRDGVNYFA